MSFAGRVLRFPERRAVGHLYNLLPDGSWDDLGRAQGELWVPVAARLHLTITEPREVPALASVDPHAFYSIDVHRVEVRDPQMAAVGRLVGLRRLFLSRTPSIGDGAMTRLRGLWALKSLALDRTSVGDSGLPAIGRLGALQELDLAHTAVVGPGLEALAGLVALRRLDLSHTGVDDAAIAPLRALPRLEELVVRGTRVTASGAEGLRARLRGLKVVGDLAAPPAPAGGASLARG
jgi:hypothetical protein